VTTSQEAGLLGASDEEQLTHAHSEGRVLFTLDGDFVGIHRSGVEHSGIVFCRQNRHSWREVILRLVMIWEVYDAEDMKHKLEFL